MTDETELKLDEANRVAEEAQTRLTNVALPSYVQDVALPSCVQDVVFPRMCKMLSRQHFALRRNVFLPGTAVSQLKKDKIWALFIFFIPLKK